MQAALGVFEPQQFDLAVDAAGVAGRRAVAADDPMTRYDDRHRVAGDGRTDRAHCARTPDVAGDVAVAARGTRLDAQQCVPDRALKRRSEQIQRNVENLQLAGKVVLQLPNDARQQRIVRPQRGRERAGMVLLPLEPRTGQPRWRASQQQRAERGIESHLRAAGSADGIGGQTHGVFSKLFQRRSTA